MVFDKIACLLVGLVIAFIGVRHVLRAKRDHEISTFVNNFTASDKDFLVSQWREKQKAKERGTEWR